jgi:hypothetical protein
MHEKEHNGQQPGQKHEQGANLTQSGLPVGIQIVDKGFDDSRILGLCKLVQRANPIGWPKLS